MLYPYRDHPVSTTEQTSPPPPSLTSHSSFPILAISTVGILTTIIFLLSYYVFVIKCCLIRHRPDAVRRRWRNATDHAPSSSSYLPSAVARGLDQPTIQAIPTRKFRRGEQRGWLHECAVCLNEFHDEEGVRMLPNCSHPFHVDCIDTWLQTHANCPLCRAEITRANPMPVAEYCHVTIDVVRDEENNDQTPRSDRHASNSPTYSCVGLERKLKHKVLLSLGDECIDLRGKDEDFAVQPIRRSFSMGSSSDRDQLYMAVQERLRQNLHGSEAGNGEGTSVTSNSWRIRRNFLSLGGHCRPKRELNF